MGRASSAKQLSEAASPARQRKLPEDPDEEEEDVLAPWRRRRRKASRIPIRMMSDHAFVRYRIRTVL